MKNFFKAHFAPVVGFIAFAAIIVLSMAACGGGGDDGDGDGGGPVDNGRWLISLQETYTVSDGKAGTSPSSKTERDWIKYSYTDDKNYSEKYSTETDTTYTEYENTRNGQTYTSTTETITAPNGDIPAKISSSKTIYTYDLPSGFTSMAHTISPTTETITNYDITLISDTGGIKTYKHKVSDINSYSYYDIQNGKTIEIRSYINDIKTSVSTYIQPDAQILAEFPNFTLYRTNYYNSSGDITSSSSQTAEVLSAGNTIYKIRTKTFGGSNDEPQKLISQIDTTYKKSKLISKTISYYDGNTTTDCTVKRSGDYSYIEINGGIAIVGYSRKGTYANIPAQINGKPVIMIGGYQGDGTSQIQPFSKCWLLTGVTIPNSVTRIRSDAFSDCTSLTKINTNDLSAWCKIDFGYGPFDYKTSLYINNELATNITIPNSVTSIGNKAFGGCTSLTSVTISNGVTSIGNQAFYDCTNLNTITIPNSVTSIGYDAFYGTAWYNNQPDGVIYINTWAIGYKGSDPSSLTFKEDTTRIYRLKGSSNNSVTSVTIPNSVTIIGNEAFCYFTGLTNITIPSSVTSIGQYAFYGCTSLTNITIPSSVTSIGKYAFGSCTSLTSVTFATGSNISDFGDYAFPGEVIPIDDWRWRENGGNSLRDAYLAAKTKAGTYTRSTNGSTWKKQ